METHQFSKSVLHTNQYQFHMYQAEFDHSGSQSHFSQAVPSVEGHRRGSSGGGGLALHVCWVRCAEKPGGGKRYLPTGKGQDTLSHELRQLTLPHFSYPTQ